MTCTCENLLLLLHFTDFIFLIDHAPQDLEEMFHANDNVNQSAGLNMHLEKSEAMFKIKASPVLVERKIIEKQ